MSRIFEEIADERGKQSKLGRKLRMNRERNWMLALVLNTYAKAADGIPTNDLDAIALAAFDRAGMGERMREHGRGPRCRRRRVGRGRLRQTSPDPISRPPTPGRTSGSDAR